MQEAKQSKQMWAKQTRINSFEITYGKGQQKHLFKESFYSQRSRTLGVTLAKPLSSR